MTDTEITMTSALISISLFEALESTYAARPKNAILIFRSMPQAIALVRASCLLL
jgi:hypothetical protein